MTDVRSLTPAQGPLVAPSSDSATNARTKVFADYFDVYTERDLSPELTAEIAAWKTAHLGK